MSRGPRVSAGEHVYHVINRANARAAIFRTEADYAHFMEILKGAIERTGMRVLAYEIMPNHWHLLLHPRHDGDLSIFMQWLTLTHTQQWHARTKSIGYGHLYQGRFKSFVVEQDNYLLAVLKYIERNARRAGLVSRAEEWRWGSASERLSKKNKILSELPIDLPDDYEEWINQPDKEEEIKRLRISVNRGRPFGGDEWTERMVREFGLDVTIRERGRPRKGT